MPSTSTCTAPWSSEQFEDGEGELLRRVRAAVGPGVPIAISLDYHANVTPQMVETTDSLVAYRTYPHVDRPETGQHAARALSLLLERGRPAGRALRKLPFLIPLNDQCTLVEPSKGVVARSVVDDGDLVNLSYLAGFPPSDLYWCGPAVIAHAWSQEAADRAADALAREIASKEAEFAVPMVSPRGRRARGDGDRAHRRAPRRDVRHPGQSRLRRHRRHHRLLEALVRLGAEGAMLGYLCDAQAASAAHKAGEGAEITIALGGRSGPEGVTPFRAPSASRASAPASCAPPAPSPAAATSTSAPWRCSRSAASASPSPASACRRTTRPRSGTSASSPRSRRSSR